MPPLKKSSEARPGFYPTPTKPGYYWAKWKIAGEDTSDELVMPDKWEVVEIFENSMDKTRPEYLMVSVPGVSNAQAIENFFWGLPVICPHK